MIYVQQQTKVFLLQIRQEETRHQHVNSLCLIYWLWLAIFLKQPHLLKQEDGIEVFTQGLSCQEKLLVLLESGELVAKWPKPVRDSV